MLASSLLLFFLLFVALLIIQNRSQKIISKKKYNNNKHTENKKLKRTSRREESESVRWWWKWPEIKMLLIIDSLCPHDSYYARSLYSLNIYFVGVKLGVYIWSSIDRPGSRLVVYCFLYWFWREVNYIVW